jgi:hypothetical protein
MCHGTCLTVLSKDTLLLMLNLGIAVHENELCISGIKDRRESTHENIYYYMRCARDNVTLSRVGHTGSVVDPREGKEQ